MTAENLSRREAVLALIGFTAAGCAATPPVRNILQTALPSIEPDPTITDSKDIDPTITETHEPTDIDPIIEESTETPQPTEVKELDKWEGSTIVKIDEDFGGVDYKIIDPEKTNKMHTRVMLEAVASWEMIRLFSSNENFINGTFGTYTKPTWITDKQLRAYNNFDSVPSDALHAFKEEVSSDKYFSYPNEGDPINAFSDKAKEAIWGYADYLEEYLTHSNGILEDFVYPNINRVRTEDETSFLDYDTAFDLEMSPPQDLDLKKGIVYKFRTGSGGTKTIPHNWMHMSWGIDSDNRFSLNIYDSPYQESEWPALNVVVALKTFARGGASLYIRLVDRATEDTLKQSNQDSIIEMEVGRTRSVVPGTSFLEIVKP